MLKISSWNINGLRASLKNDAFFNWVSVVKPDIIGLQEVKADVEQVPGAFWQNDGENAYEEIWHSGVRKGYSGALLLSKQSTGSSILGLDEPEFLNEGRVIEADFDAFTLLTAYFPNGGRNSERLDYKLRFYEAFLERIRKLRKDGKSVIFMGDLNVAHKAIDLARPEENIKNSGYLEVEREWVDRVISSGFHDTFRVLHPDQRDVYSYWDPWRKRRERNIGWRIDYIFISEELLPLLKKAYIQPEFLGSDHCPVNIEIDIKL